MKLAFIPIFLFVIPYVSAFSRRESNQGGAGASGVISGNPQTALALDPLVISFASSDNGMVPGPNTENLSPSATSLNNFINFCAGKTITNGQQIKGGSCNSIPGGEIPPASSMPSCQFRKPKNGDVIPANQDFTVVQEVHNMVTGFASNANLTFLAAPQKLNGTLITGHSHVIIQDVTKLADPQQFAFFKALNFAAVDGLLSTVVSGGLPPGEYRLCTYLSSMNHAPVILPVAQRGSTEDCVRVRVTSSANGGNTGGNAGNGGATNIPQQADVKIGGRKQIKRRFAREIA